MKTVLFVPGFQENIDSREYRKTFATIERAGYHVQCVDINWKYTTIDQWSAELLEVYREYDPKETILAGFSFGATTALVVAAERNPHAVWLFSLSPYFSEDLTGGGVPASWLKIIGSRRQRAFCNIHFSALVQSINSKILFFYGTQELATWPNMHYRARMVRKLPHAKEIIIQDGQHDVASAVYVAAIEKAISRSRES